MSGGVVVVDDGTGMTPDGPMGPPRPTEPTPVIVPVPGPDPATALPPEFFDMRRFTRYDENGHITEFGSMGLAFILGEKIQGVRIIEGEGEGREATHYVDAEDGNPELVERPVLTEIPATLKVAPGVEARIPGLPPCTIRFTGPLKGEQPHPALGDALIGFRVPGTYRLTAEPWPYRDIEIELKVRPL